MCCFLPFGAKVFLSGGSRTIGHRRGNPSDGRRYAFPSYQTLRATLAAKPIFTRLMHCIGNYVLFPIAKSQRYISRGHATLALQEPVRKQE